MPRSYVIEKTLEVVITEDDLVNEEELTEDLALEIAEELDLHEWQAIDIQIVGVQ